MKGKSIVILCAMLCTTLIAWGILFWPTLYRYDKSKGRPARINRVTGYTEILYSSGWKPTISEQDVTVIPYEEVAKIELKSKQINKEGIYNILIYNGSSWTITKLRLSIRKIDSELMMVLLRFLQVLAL
jgi:hypothetical protein